MSITIEPTTARVVCWQVTHLGYVRCGDCIDETLGGEVFEDWVMDSEEPARVVERRIDRGVGCDSCDRQPADWSVLTVPARAVVEHFDCKIF